MRVDMMHERDELGEEDWLRQGWRSETGIHSRDEAMHVGMSGLIFNDELAWGRARVTTEELQVYSKDWRKIYEGWVFVGSLYVRESSL